MDFFSVDQTSFLQLTEFFAPKVLLAIFCGALIGLERELKNKSAGLKTNMLICFGSTVYTGVSVLMHQAVVDNGFPGDPSRVAAQVVSGIGFLGAGTIIQSRGTIKGLTTAATIWVVAAIGICLGAGYYLLAIASTIFVLVALILSTYFEDQILDKKLVLKSDIYLDDPAGSIRNNINDLLETFELELKDFDLTHKDGLTRLKLSYFGNRSNHKAFLMKLWSIPGIKEIKHK